MVILSPSACSPSGGGGGGGGAGGGSTTTTTPPAVTPVVVESPVVVTPAVIEGCGSRTTGFSTTTGVSCAGNTGTTPEIPTTTPTTPASSVSSYDFGSSILKNGSTGEAVKELQRFLNATLNLGLVVDGELGPKTIAVIKQWQTDHGLVADGLVGPATKAAMLASL